MRLIDGSLAAIGIALDTATQAGAAVVTATATATGCTYILATAWTASKLTEHAFTAAGQRFVCLIESVKPKFN